MDENMLQYVRDLAAEHGWTDNTTVIVLCDGIDAMINKLKLDRSEIAEIIEERLP